MPYSPAAIRSDFKAFKSLPTRWMDNDQYGHMNNTVHYALIDNAVGDWQLEQGFFDTKGEITKLMVVESGCQYFGEAGYPDVIHVGLRLGHIGNSSWRYDLGLFRNETDTAFAQGHLTQVLVDAKTGRSKSLSQYIRSCLQGIG